MKNVVLSTSDGLILFYTNDENPIERATNLAKTTELELDEKAHLVADDDLQYYLFEDRVWDNEVMA